jgi:hypothetical protein
MMMIGDDDEMINFLHSLYNGILRARGEHKLLFVLAFAFRTFILLLAFFALKNSRTLKTLCQTFASVEKCLRPVKNVRAQPLRLKRNVCGLWKMFAPNLCAWREMFAAYEKCSRPTFAPEEKCLRPMKKCLRLMTNVCGLWKRELKGKEIRNQN